VAFGIFNFLAYGTTATVARRIGAGDPKSAAEHGVAGVWLALGLGLALAAFGLALSGPIVPRWARRRGSRPTRAPTCGSR
jgi:Na+-driven multidrug efflux pump